MLATSEAGAAGNQLQLLMPLTEGLGAQPISDETWIRSAPRGLRCVRCPVRIHNFASLRRTGAL
jgi:hypothetical protein